MQNALQEIWCSYKYRQPVTQVIRGRIGNTVILGGIGFVITFAGALLLGLLCAAKENSVFDRVMCKVGTLSSCIPEFWLSLVFILLFSVIWRILPSSGAYSIGQEANLADRIRHLIMPMAVVILEHLWYYAYMIRNRLLEETRRDYVLLCKAKGMSRGQIMAPPLPAQYYADLYQSDGDLCSAYSGRHLYRRDGIFLSGHRNAVLRKRPLRRLQYADGSVPADRCSCDLLQHGRTDHE